MPNGKVLLEKQQVVVELIERIKGSGAGVFVDYKGINVAEVTALRTELRKAGVEYSVIKNTLTRFALKEVGMSDLDDILNGTTALATSKDDLVAPAKVISEFIKKNKKMQVKAGFVEGGTLDANGVMELASLPPKEVLIAKVLGGLNAPISGLVTVLNGNIRGLVVALNAIAEKKAG